MMGQRCSYKDLKNTNRTSIAAMQMQNWLQWIAATATSRIMKLKFQSCGSWPLSGQSWLKQMLSFHYIQEQQQIFGMVGSREDGLCKRQAVYWLCLSPPECILSHMG
ncbi:hypothetical protein TcWFU_005705 [Taenia crassiceps]|uniref:Uncharacterized protein n=1 Tax=Taenia crassiceps TaxID=6207 RepID=A0ABR4QQW8_9CEST